MNETKNGDSKKMEKLRERKVRKAIDLRKLQIDLIDV